MKKYLPTFLIFVTSIIFYLPILINPNLILARGNDLQQQFWPVFYYVRENFLKFHQIPLWNNLFFSGTPLLPDPQFSPVYPGNLLFLILPTNQAFFLFLFIHSLLAGITSYILAKKGLNFSTYGSIFFSLLYITTPKLAGYLEAGHYGLFAAHAWIPLAIYAVFKLSKKANLKSAILLGVSFSGLYFTHTIIFLIASIVSLIFFLYLIISNKKNNVIKKLILFVIAAVIAFGLSAVTLLPQLNWAPQTTRNLLSIHPDIFPKWNSISEFFSNFFLTSHTGIQTIDEEKWITIGNFTLAFTLIGFAYLARKVKLIVLITLAGSFIIMINNLSPFYPTLLFENWYQLIRVTTRFWFIPGTILIILAAFGFEKLMKNFSKPLNILILGVAVLAIFESLYTSETRITQKPFISDTYIQNDILSFLKSDKSQFRIFCTTRCVSQQQTAINNLELVEGYNTLQQTNYYDITREMMGGWWDYYTLPIPPSGVGKLTPDPKLLGEYNVKYILSPYALNNDNFLFLNIYKNNFYLYRNNLYKPRSNQQIIFYSPNLIKINITDNNSNLILRDVYNPDWKAYVDSGKEIKITETADKTREIAIPKNTHSINFIYNPISLKIGLTVTLSTITILILKAFFYVLKHKNNNSKN